MCSLRFLRIFNHYTNEKLLRGWLDFDDLILKTQNLLTDPTIAAWYYIGWMEASTILIDEAQDTSPTQWRIIEKLSRFYTGEGSGDKINRTLLLLVTKNNQFILSRARTLLNLTEFRKILKNDLAKQPNL